MTTPANTSSASNGTFEIQFVKQMIGQASPVAKFGGLVAGLLVGVLLARSSGKKKGKSR
jgi:hypothetical protein